MTRSEPYLRWHEVRGDATGANRASDSNCFARLNEGTMGRIREMAEEEGLGVDPKAGPPAGRAEEGGPGGIEADPSLPEEE